MVMTIVLFCMGVSLVLAEFFVPGGVLGVLGGCLVIASTAYGWYTFPAYGMWIAFGEFVGTGLFVTLGFYLMTRTGAGKLLTLSDTQETAAGWSSPHADASLQGQEGEVYSALRPSGTVIVNGERVNAVSDAQFIEKGARVRVIEVEGHRVVVERVDGPEAAEGTPA